MESAYKLLCGAKSSLLLPNILYESLPYCINILTGLLIQSFTLNKNAQDLKSCEKKCISQFFQNPLFPFLLDELDYKTNN